MDIRRDEPGVESALEAAKRAYLRQDYRAAADAGKRALESSITLGDERGQVHALRELGAALYRLGDVAASEAYLREALRLADGAAWESESLLVRNQLGSSLRKLGRLEEADAVFREALLQADPRAHLEARARLTGSYGAFLDDLGDRAASDDQYARHEELISLLPEPGRLANARGLASRSARLRGDLQLALAKAEDERRLGALSREPTRELRGWQHVAQARADMGDAPGADQAFAEASSMAVTSTDVRVPIGVALAHGRFLLDQHRIHEADARVGAAIEALGNLAEIEDEHRAKAHQLASEVAAAAGLHGEALWHLAKALESQLRRFEPISDLRLLHLTRWRRAELVVLGQRLLAEASVVEREPEESKRVLALLERLQPRGRQVAISAGEPVDDWRARVRLEAITRWHRLLPTEFAFLGTASSGDLVLADVVYQGPVGDLSRSLSLLFGTVERELRDRVFEPLRRRASRRLKSPSGFHRGLCAGRHLGLGDMLHALDEPTVAPAPEDALYELLRHVGPAREELRRLGQPGVRVDGKAVKRPIKIRNAIAHGEDAPLTRNDADAVRRLLTLGPEPTLRVVLAIPVLGS